MLDIFNLAQLKFYHKLLNLNAPAHFHTLPFVSRESMHGLNIRYGQELNAPRIHHTVAQNSIRLSIPTLTNATPRNIADKLHTHSFNSFVKYTQLNILKTIIYYVYVTIAMSVENLIKSLQHEMKYIHTT